MYYNISEWAYFNLMWKTTKKRCDNNRKDVASMRVGTIPHEYLLVFVSRMVIEIVP